LIPHLSILVQCVITELEAHDQMVTKQNSIAQLFGMFFVLLMLIVSILPTIAQDTPTDPNCPNAPAPRLTVEGSGRVLPGDANNVREQPARASTLLGAIPGGTEFTVLEGPICADDLIWWRVRTDDITGWTVEGSGSDYWIEPLAQPAAPSTWSNPYRNPEYRISNPMIIGAIARVQTMTGEPLPVFANPDDATSIGEFSVNTLVTLLEEGTDGWWHVESEDGTNGWVREAIDYKGKLRPTIAPICPYTEDRVLFLARDSVIGTNLYTVRQEDGARLCNLSYGLQQNFLGYDWSPDGQWIAYSAILEGTSDYGDLYVESVDGRILQRLTNNQRIAGPQWSPDGKWIAVQMDGTEPSTRDIRLISPDGLEQLTLYTTTTRFGVMRWSPDGKYLAVADNDTVSFGRSKLIRLIEVETGDSRIIYTAKWEFSSLNWSPDSTFLVTPNTNDDEWMALLEIDIHNQYGEYEELLIGSTYGATYSPDGSKIAYWKSSNGIPRWVEVLDRETGEVTRLAALTGYNGSGLDWMPEGDAVLVSSNGVMRIDAITGALRSIFVSDDGSNRYSSLMQPSTG